MSEHEIDKDEQGDHADPGVYELPGDDQQDSAQPLDHRELDDELSEGKKASEDLHGTSTDDA